MHVNKHIFKPTRIVISILAGFFITIHGHWDKWLEALVSPSFYVAVLVSYCICYLLLYFIHYISVKLDRRVPWDRNVLIRIILQLFLGVCIPIILDIALASVYIAATGRDLRNSGFLENDFPIIVIFLVVVNAFYPVYHYLKKAMVKSETATSMEFQENTLMIRHNHNRLSLDIDQDIFGVIKIAKNTNIITMDGQEFTTNETLQALEDRLQTSNFLRINRSTLLNAHVILGYRIGEKRRTLEIILKPNYQSLIAPSMKDFLVVTGEQVPLVRAHFD